MAFYWWNKGTDFKSGSILVRKQKLLKCNIKSIEDVEYAFLETNGKLSIFKYNIFKTEGTYPLALIVDGVIQSKTLKEIRHSKYWLLNYLNKQDTDLNNVFYAFYKNKKIYLIKYTDLKSV